MRNIGGGAFRTDDEFNDPYPVCITCSIEGAVDCADLCPSGNRCYLYFGSAVTYIGDSAFQKNKFIQRVYIPDTLTTIGNYAFYELEILSKVFFPSTLVSIGKFSFSRCTALESIDIPAGSIGIIISITKTLT